MPRLPVVVAWNKNKKRKEIINATDYQRLGLLFNPNYKIMSIRHGDVATAEVDWHAIQAANEEKRAAKPDHPASKDAQRLYEQQQARPVIQTEQPKPKETKMHDSKLAESNDGEVSADWRRMRWFEARRHVKDVTGTLPDSKEHAEQLMAAHAMGDC